MKNQNTNNHEDNLFIERFSLHKFIPAQSPGILLDLTAAPTPLKHIPGTTPDPAAAIPRPRFTLRGEKTLERFNAWAARMG